MSRHLVCLTFDFDTTSLFTASGLTSPSALSRGEFGALASRRILDLLHRYGLRATWFVPGHTIMSFPREFTAVVEAGHEIANHGFTHRSMAQLGRDEQEQELLDANALIRQHTGADPVGFRAPGWELAEQTVPLLIEHGFQYDSSMMASDHQPYFARVGDHVDPRGIRFGTPSPLVEVPVSWSLDDFPVFEFWPTDGGVIPGLRSTAEVEANWFDDFEYLRRSVPWGVLVLTLHPFVIGRGHRMLMLERLIVRLLNAGAVFTPIHEAVREWQGDQR
ncbi:polysaccharide deacetylase [Dactylosporangium sucinum]|uniref:NodB homology domain-containing protein n=1 Tax=Dactylosporangium sucinum TaxID=1424081 RepID=A0A917UBM7_9ACTN|nr:polysaccharide deacetylase [Dactylosporangium sucinum]GGM69746.1 hypothetical protein GCM10007977_084330 [Dactylosporangium sucinum]